MSKVVLVSGAGRGIGAGICEAFSRQPDTIVFLHYNSSEEKAGRLQMRLKEEGCDVRLKKADLRSEEEIVCMVREILEDCGHIDVLVNNAAVAEQKLYTDITAEDWDRIFDINVKGMFLLTREVLSAMLWEKQGRIINISSIWGICGGSMEVAYSASKAAVIGMTKALAKEAGPSGITVNCVAPGVIDTDMNASLSEETMELLKEETPLGQIGKPEDVAGCVTFLASEQARFITGQILSPNGGIVI